MLKKLSKMLGIGLTVALLTSLLAVAAPASALSEPEVTFPTTNDQVISTPNADYAIFFTLAQELVGGDTITVTFPAGTTLAAPSGEIAASQGWINSGANYGAATIGTLGAVVGTGTWAFTATTITYTLDNGVTANEQIGAQAQVRLLIENGITNPNEISDAYTLTVHTSKETTPVTSGAYSMNAPTILPLPGVVETFNAAGVRLASVTGGAAIQTAINAATSAGCVVKIGAGTYNESPVVGTGGITIEAAAETSSVIVNGDWTVNVASASATYPNTTIKGLTMYPAAAGNTAIAVGAAAVDVVVDNCVISNAPSTAVAGTLITVAVGATRTSVTNCTIDTTEGAVADIAIQSSDDITVSGNEFSLDATTGGVDDVAVDAIAAGTFTVSDNTFTGNSGIGVQDITGAAALVIILDVNGNTFTGLQNALVVNNQDATGAAGATVTFNSNTVSDSTTVANPTVGTADAAIDIIDSRNSILIQKNTIENNAGISVKISAAVTIANVSFIGNVLTGNAIGLLNNHGTALDAVLNFWGDNTGPTISSNPDGVGDPIVGTAGPVNYIPWSNTATSEVAADLNVGIGGLVDRSTSVGIVYSTTALLATPGVTLMKYDANPGMTDPPAPAIDGGYYDVYSPNAAGSGGVVTLMFYNTNITQDTKVYYYSALQQGWQVCEDQDVAGNNAYAYVKVGNGALLPGLAELDGTIFALVTKKTIPAAPTIVKPVIGDVDITIAPLFTWNVVPGATDYEVIVSADPSYTFVDFKAASTNGQTFYKHTADLEYGETYYWKVAAKMADGSMTDYSSGIFSTMSEAAAVDAEPGDIVVEVPPIEIPEIQMPEFPTQDNEPAIPTYILWIIVVIGAILIVALIVLIVRTRRVN